MHESEGGNGWMTDVEWTDVDPTMQVSEAGVELPRPLPPELAETAAITTRREGLFRLAQFALFIGVELAWFALIGYLIWRLVV